MELDRYNEKDPAKVAKRRAKLKAVPGGDQTFRDLYAEGLVTGWSAVIGVDEPEIWRGMTLAKGPYHTGRECCKKD